ncbi:protein DpdD [Lentzea sp. NPDC034063]|uniref:protein DpdD n=1 Tax=unclassified Lentzea TaxID=2643253 RepID=UPI0034052463
MNSRTIEPARTPASLQNFLREFFSASHNDAWPDMGAGGWAARVKPFVDQAVSGANAPIVLPWLRKATDEFAVYVLAPARADVVKTSLLITAFAGHSYISDDSDSRPAVMDPNNPVERAVLDFCGPGVTFKLRTQGIRIDRSRLTDSLMRMQSTAASRPPRHWRVVKPTGKLLAEFDSALAAGGEQASADLLGQLQAKGGLDATNLAFLSIKRLNRLGRDVELLSLPRLEDVVRQSPPAPVRDAILEAIYCTVVAEHLDSGELDAALTALRWYDTDVRGLFHHEPHHRSAESLAVDMLVCILRTDIDRLARLKVFAIEDGYIAQLPGVLIDEVATLLPSTDPTQTIADVASEVSTPGSWLDLMEAASAAPSSFKTALEQEAWSEWPSPAATDDQIAAVLDDLTRTAADRVWDVTGAFINALGADGTAPAAATSFIGNALLCDRFGPGDLLALHALVNIVLRSGPKADRYQQLLEDIGAECERWVAVDRALIVLDLVDSLIVAACPNETARSDFAYRVLGPLANHGSRLDDHTRGFALQLTTELNLGLQWASAEDPSHRATADVEDWRSSQVSLLLYSLDEKVLTRASERLQVEAPNVKLVLRSDHVGGPQLRQHVRNADAVVMVTRCATHAATGFISQHIAQDRIAYVEGAGSASVLQTAIAQIKKLTDDLS